MTGSRYGLVSLVLIAAACGGSVNSDGSGGGPAAAGNGGAVTVGGAGSGTGGTAGSTGGTAGSTGGPAGVGAAGNGGTAGGGGAGGSAVDDASSGSGGGNESGTGVDAPLGAGGVGGVGDADGALDSAGDVPAADVADDVGSDARADGGPTDLCGSVTVFLDTMSHHPMCTSSRNKGAEQLTLTCDHIDSVCWCSNGVSFNTTLEEIGLGCNARDQALLFAVHCGGCPLPDDGGFPPLDSGQ